MIVQQIGKRGFILTFEDDISLYLVRCSRFYLLCDTHLGPKSMEEIFAFIQGDPSSDRVIIFNSHSDWDHIWGNCAFPDSFIIGHELCRKRMQERGLFDIRQNYSLQRGDIVITLPNLTFSDRLAFGDENILFSYAPGHTIDSSVCYDQRDQVLYLGDLVENPVPYLDAADLESYLVTLRSFLTHPAHILVSAHSGIVNRELILDNIAYINKVKEGIPVNPEESGGCGEVHQWNLNMRIIYELEPRIRENQENGYSLTSILEIAGDLHTTSPEEIRHLLEDYLSRL
jgi:glyoxylase-like metal-dependent hydrolase (beta-lactamase superfamily II)